MTIIFGYGLDITATTTLTNLDPDSLTLPMALLTLLAVWFGVTLLSLSAALVRPSDSASWDDDPTLGDEMPETSEEVVTPVNRVFHNQPASRNGVGH